MLGTVNFTSDNLKRKKLRTAMVYSLDNALSREDEPFTPVFSFSSSSRYTLCKETKKLSDNSNNNNNNNYY